MSWWNSAWTRRRPIALDHLIAGVAAEDYTITISPTDEEFWGTVKSDGSDVRVISPLGIPSSALTYRLASWTYASRLAIIELDNVTPPLANCIHVAHLYWGNAAAVDASGAFAAAAPRNGYLHSGEAGYPLIPARQAGFKALRPPTRIAKTATESLHLWWDASLVLQKHRVAYNGHLQFEEISYLQFAALKAAADQAAEHDDTDIRVIDPGYVRTTWKAGTDTEDRALALTIYTTFGRVINPRAWGSVNTTDEA